MATLCWFRIPELVHSAAQPAKGSCPSFQRCSWCHGGSAGKHLAYCSGSTDKVMHRTITTVITMMATRVVRHTAQCQPAKAEESTVPKVCILGQGRTPLCLDKPGLPHVPRMRLGGSREF